MSEESRKIAEALGEKRMEAIPPMHPTLRDRFAMAAPWEYLVAVAEKMREEMSDEVSDATEASTVLAAAAYNYADSMLKERAK